MEKLDQKDDKLTLVKLRSSVKNYRNLKDVERLLLTETAKDFFHFIDSFANYEK